MNSPDTQWLNPRGGIEADVTVTRLSETAFLVVTIAAGQRRDFAWLQRHIPADAHAVATDISPGLTMLSLMGPRSRALISALSGEQFDNAAFPFGTSREIELGYGIVRASRLTFVGELGWEMLIPTDFAKHVLEEVLRVGADFDLRHGGYFAINSMRMEKGYRHWGHDISDEDTPLEAGLGFAVAFDKPSGFIGREALLCQRDQRPLAKRLIQVRLDAGSNPPLLYHEEPILKDGRIVGAITSGSYGHRVGASLGMGYVRCDDGVTAEWLAADGIEVEVACARYPATAQLRPFYDPKNTRVRDHPGMAATGRENAK